MKSTPDFCQITSQKLEPIYSISIYCLSVTTGLDKLLMNYNLVNPQYTNFGL